MIAVKLIWHTANLLEVDWIRDILDGIVEEEVTDLDSIRFDDGAIHVVSSNQRPLLSYGDYFRACRARCKHMVLFHASDEWFSGGYGVYQYFDLVVRCYRTNLADCRGILTVPLGYPNNGRATRAIQPAHERTYVWAFVGEIKASRYEMVAALEGLEPNLLMPTTSRRAAPKLGKAEFDGILAKAVFAPCPMGNVVLETWRLYESLEAGCIPIVKSRLTLDYFRELFGCHPLPTFRRWSDARRYAQAALADPAGLSRVQAEIQEWWIAQKAKLRSDVRKAISGPSQESALSEYGSLLRNRLTLIHEPLRLVQLLRHQNGGSLRHRLLRPIGPLKRILRESVGDLR